MVMERLIWSWVDMRYGTKSTFQASTSTPLEKSVVAVVFCFVFLCFFFQNPPLIYTLPNASEDK